ncbi:MAG TPA: hypothetical protein VOA41_08940 [Candidatus Dormibacteraeota bacterium]|nr:hypothetical protein [Candidatus Dormibacteraeota bacterium]
MRYRRAFVKRYEVAHSAPNVFMDLQLPRFGMGQVDLDDVPGFTKLLQEVQKKRYEIVYIDLDEVTPGLTPDYESAFVRSLLENAGATVLNAFSDDSDAFKQALRDRCGERARDYEVTDSSDFVCFFPSLTSEITASALRRELQDAASLQSEQLQRIYERIDDLKRQRPYSGGTTPFIEDRLSAEWRKLK